MDSLKSAFISLISLVKNSMVGEMLTFASLLIILLTPFIFSIVTNLLFINFVYPLLAVGWLYVVIKEQKNG